MSEKTMIERVAMAMCPAKMWEWDHCQGDCRCTSCDHKRMWRSHARAAIEAMREPTEAMLRAAAYRNQGPDDGMYGSIFTAMITAALQSEPESKGEVPG